MGNYLLAQISEVPVKELETALEQAPEKSDPASWLVVLLGIAVVFGGLLLLIGLVDLMNATFRKAPKAEEPNASVPAQTIAPQPANNTIENKQELIAAICAAVAEENGTDINAIRVISFKKL